METARDGQFGDGECGDIVFCQAPLHLVLRSIEELGIRLVGTVLWLSSSNRGLSHKLTNGGAVLEVVAEGVGITPAVEGPTLMEGLLSIDLVRIECTRGYEVM